MELLTDAIQTTINSFDFAFCIVVNILTYCVIKFIDDCNGDKAVNTWIKRLILFIVILFVSAAYYYNGTSLKLVINSAILAPVFWSWIMKPLCKKFNIDYKQLN